ncbi:hypothetical protein GUITHDRAFT_104415 [Guillardia theta CCMP2712]|uniref:Uncharacterized protein n=2 Tax=Guillardia theta TaxID=55529 RepID=L1JNI5_GUITC|nr:hypothetical protein GUITHDRAFT_104415 [Guillardia theta CCMP2712]EKX50017.1 hypothetical protein GUITHDRAFT_104415 [Guillardia theta CCMP2712]|mmetsp:Transcript_2226/g.6762  ORF Transcript_2226/g.6762 Transcript_2226/m.6762 type:complete len:182 (+) Transcript_2226:274-819(+)|eukprot:XP_005836997.1 hypothetical protein GUITHDRAFT_104415 [Guillardia theta CCMP2712]
MAGTSLALAGKRPRCFIRVDERQTECSDQGDRQQPRDHPSHPLGGLLWSDFLSLQEINLNLALAFALPGTASLISQLPMDALQRLAETIREEWLADRRNEGLLTPPTSPRIQQEQRVPPNCKVERRLMKLKHRSAICFDHARPIADVLSFPFDASNILSFQRDRDFIPKGFLEDHGDETAY